MFDLRDSLYQGYHHHHYYLSAVLLYSWRASSFFRPEADPTTALHISSVSGVTDSQREGVLTEETCYLGLSAAATVAVR